MTVSISSVLKLFKLPDIVKVIIASFGLTDLVGWVVNWLKDQYLDRGREWVIRAASIKEASVRQWAWEVWTKSRSNATKEDQDFKDYADNLVRKRTAFAIALADFVEAFF